MTGVDVSQELRQGLEMPKVQLYAERLAAALRRAWTWVCAKHAAVRVRHARRSLRVAESISLGDKRAVYLVEVDGQRLLLGASAAGVTLLSRLPPPKEAWQQDVKELMFADVLDRCEDAKPPRRKTRPVPIKREAA